MDLVETIARGEAGQEEAEQVQALLEQRDRLYAQLMGTQCIACAGHEGLPTGTVVYCNHCGKYLAYAEAE